MKQDKQMAKIWKKAQRLRREEKRQEMERIFRPSRKEALRLSVQLAAME